MAWLTPKNYGDIEVQTQITHKSSKSRRYVLRVTEHAVN